MKILQTPPWLVCLLGLGLWVLTSLDQLDASGSASMAGAIASAAYVLFMIGWCDAARRLCFQISGARPGRWIAYVRNAAVMGILVNTIIAIAQIELPVFVESLVAFVTAFSGFTFLTVTARQLALITSEPRPNERTFWFFAGFMFFPLCIWWLERRLNLLHDA